MKLSSEQKAILASYARSVIGAALAAYTATGDPKAALNALWAALVPVAMRYFNTSDTAFGKKK